MTKSGFTRRLRRFVESHFGDVIKESTPEIINIGVSFPEAFDQFSGNVGLTTLFSTTIVTGPRQ